MRVGLFYQYEVLISQDVQNALQDLNTDVAALLMQALYPSASWVVMSGYAAAANSPADNGIAIASGVAMQNGSLIDQSGFKVNILPGSYPYGSGLAADPTNPRWDAVGIQYTTAQANLQSRTFDSPASSPQNIYTTQEDSFGITVVHGVAAATPAKPSLPTGYSLLAYVYVPATSTTVTSTNVYDQSAASKISGGRLGLASGGILTRNDSNTTPELDTASGLLFKIGTFGSQIMDNTTAGYLDVTGSTNGVRFKSNVNFGTGQISLGDVTSVDGVIGLYPGNAGSIFWLQNSGGTLGLSTGAAPGTPTTTFTSSGMTLASGQTLSMNGATLSGTISGTPTWTGDHVWSWSSMSTTITNNNISFNRPNNPSYVGNTASGGTTVISAAGTDILTVSSTGASVSGTGVFSGLLTANAGANITGTLQVGTPTGNSNLLIVEGMTTGPNNPTSPTLTSGFFAIGAPGTANTLNLMTLDNTGTWVSKIGLSSGLAVGTGSIRLNDPLISNYLLTANDGLVVAGGLINLNAGSGTTAYGPVLSTSDLSGGIHAFPAYSQGDVFAFGQASSAYTISLGTAGAGTPPTTWVERIRIGGNGVQGTTSIDLFEPTTVHQPLTTSGGISLPNGYGLTSAAGATLQSSSNGLSWVVATNNSSNIPLQVHGATGQTADLTWWTDPTGATTLAKVDASGNITATELITGQVITSSGARYLDLLPPSGGSIRMLNRAYNAVGLSMGDSTSPPLYSLHNTLDDGSGNSTTVGKATVEGGVEITYSGAAHNWVIQENSATGSLDFIYN